MLNNLKDVHDLAWELIKKHKLDDKIKKVTFSHKMQTAFGWFCPEDNEIRFLAKECVANLDNRPFIINLILHEIAHAIEYYTYGIRRNGKKRNYHSHSKNFKEIAVKINCDDKMCLEENFRVKSASRNLSKHDVERSLSGEII